ncbi:MAG: hypothetical protein QG597_1301, partial [Actinomycetota bacterium]|nr:hypothetical protein [Actinomycetota bacterium]
MSPTAGTSCRNPGLSEPETKEQWRQYLTEEPPAA